MINLDTRSRLIEKYWFDKNGELLAKPLRVYYRKGECQTPANLEKVEREELNCGSVVYSGMYDSEPYKTDRENKRNESFYGKWIKTVEKPVSGLKRGRPRKSEPIVFGAKPKGKSASGGKLLSIEEKQALTRQFLKEQEDVAV